MLVKRLYIIALFSWLAAVPCLPLLAEPGAVKQGAKYLGTGSCSSSNCHGSAHPLKGSDVLQNEYYTWTKHDQHSRAYSNLISSDARRMTSLLGLSAPNKEPLCLSCHTTYVPEQSRRGERFQIEDGVSCESCHGAAENWLESHAVTGATHKENLAHGLTDIAQLSQRATLCLSCHYGDEEKRVTHDLYGAGHPRLSFELDTFGILQPRHWVVDQDYIKRKSQYVPLLAWFAGQSTHAQSLIKMLQSQARTMDGTLPELALFDCFSCHHSLAEQQWKHQTYGGKPGQLQINLAPLLMLQWSLKALDPPLAATLGEQVAILHTSYGTAASQEALIQLTELLTKQVQPLILSAPVDYQLCKGVLQQLSLFAVMTPFPKYEVAEQIGMGIQATLASSSQLAKEYKSELDKLFKTLSQPTNFKSERFTAAATKLQRSIR